ncbi:uncharacterized protein PS065_011629 isoform 1-T1 [Dugong dugon]
MPVWPSLPRRPNPLKSPRLRERRSRPENRGREDTARASCRASAQSTPPAAPGRSPPPLRHQPGTLESCEGRGGGRGGREERGGVVDRAGSSLSPPGSDLRL